MWSRPTPAPTRGCPAMRTGRSGSLTSKARDLTVMGHVTRAEIDRVAGIFRQSEPHLGRVLVMHHNVLRGEASHRMGLTRWQKVHRWLMDSGAELVLCGHDHLEKADVMGGVVISCAGSLSARQFEGRTASFQRIVLEENSIQVEPYRWDADLKRFRRSDVFAFARKGARRDAREPAGAV